MRRILQTSQRILRQAALGHIVVIEPIGFFANQVGGIGFVIKICNDNISLIHIGLVHGDMQIIAHALGGDALWCQACALVNQLIFNLALRFNQQGLPLFACA